MTSDRFALRLTVSAFLLTLISVSLPAQDEDAPAAAAPVTDEADVQTPAEEWKSLTTRRTEIATQTAKLRAEFGTITDNAERLRLRAEFQELVDEFQEAIEPRMRALAPGILESEPDNVDALQFVLTSAWESNQYDKAADAGLHLMEMDKSTPYSANLTGVACFAAQRFDKAAEILAAAKEDGTLTDMGDRYATPAGDYIEHWKAEQELREKEAAADEDSQLPRVRLRTSRGDILVELFENEAPNTVANFIELIEAKKYDTTKFHRVIPNFMIQGGDPNSMDEDPFNDGMGGPGHSIKCECYAENHRKHFAGSLSMAHSGRDTGGSQFFVTHLPTYHLNGKHTVFGRVVDGMDIVAAVQKDDVIESAEVIRKRDHEYTAEKTADETEEE